VIVEVHATRNLSQGGVCYIVHLDYNIVAFAASALIRIKESLRNKPKEKKTNIALRTMKRKQVLK
jgi:hypothetical protein